MDHDMYRKAMTRLRVAMVVLAVSQLSLIARAVIDGVSATTAVTEAVVVVASVVVVTLWRQGRRERRSHQDP
jgi:ABC-type uncharacterized transport system YnjBCD permease subunit